MATTIAIVEDNAGICDELIELLAEVPDFACVCVCRNVKTALSDIPAQAPDVILMDIRLPDGSGIDCTAALKRVLPRSQIMIFTVHEDSAQIYQALTAGASGYLLKRTPPDEVVRAIREIRGGGAPMSGAVARKVIQAFQQAVPAGAAGDSITPREREVLELLSQGLLSKEIASQLSISLDTVSSHLKHIYEKLHVRTRTEAVIKYRG
jgi:DNA-binding NarL/FixJ family response regulator